MSCDAAIRPFPVNDTEVHCELGNHKGPHHGTLRDYAYRGSVTKMAWTDADRRTFHGPWPGSCGYADCPLPRDHSGNHVGR